MVHKKRNPAAGSTSAGAKGNVVFPDIANLAQTVAAANSPVITVRRGPGGKAEWLVSIRGVCTDTPFRDRKLRRHRRFCNAIRCRFGVSFDPMPQADWAAIVEAAIGGAP